MLYKNNETVDRVIVVKTKIDESGNLIEQASTFSVLEPIGFVLNWARLSVLPIKVFPDQQTIRKMEDELKEEIS